MRWLRNEATEGPRLVVALGLATGSTLAALIIALSALRPTYNVRGPQPVALQAGRAFQPEAEPAASAAQPAVSVEMTVGAPVKAQEYLRLLGLPANEADRWASELFKAAGVSVFQPNHALMVLRDPGNTSLRGLRYELSDRVAVVEKAIGEHLVRAEQEAIRYSFQLVSLEFTVRGGFGRTAAREHLPASVASALGKAFAHQYPVRRLPDGTVVKVIFGELASADYRHRVATGLEAAEIGFKGRRWRAFAFADRGRRPSFYDTRGEALETVALRYPVAFRYVSSGFSYRRYHPLLHRYRPHLGVDFATRYGAPVRAVADGTVEQAGWCGELGRCVRVAHGREMVSVYGHLARISSGVRPGAAVASGQVIGKVGSSGLSSGPHLHFGLQRGGRFVNPLGRYLGARHRVSPRMQALFENLKARYLALLGGMPTSGSYFEESPQQAPALKLVSGAADAQRSTSGAFWLGQGDRAGAPTAAGSRLRFGAHLLRHRRREKRSG